MIAMKRKFWIPVLLLAFHFFGASSQSTTGWLNIDCGSDTPRLDANTLLPWDTDNGLIKSGINKYVSEKQQLDEMNTVRSFPKGKQNCYKLKVYKKKVRYLIRAGFCYGNYDSLSSPPTFDLHLDGKKWTTVKTSMIGDPIYREAIYEARSDHISLCVVRVKDGGVPFISSIEVVPLEAPFPLYPKMQSSHTFNLESRVNLGGDEVIRYTGILSDEKYNRIWTPGATPPNCDEVTTDSDSSTENEPPDEVIGDSIESQNLTNPITLSVDISQTPTPQSAYVVLYFAEETFLEAGDIRIIQIYIDDHMKSTVTLEFNKCKVITIYPVIPVGPRMSVTLASDSGSNLPPMISAMEVFTKSSAPILHCRFFCALINFVISCTCLFLFLA
ncbi:putative LRR receptor-like serine/threonine-protein kinase [Rosa sericea]